VFDGLSQEDLDTAFNFLTDPSSVSQDYINQFAMENPEITRSFLMNIGIGLERGSPSIPSGQINGSSHPQEQVPLITPEKYSQPLFQSSTPSPPIPSSQTLSPSILTPGRRYHLSEEFQNDSQSFDSFLQTPQSPPRSEEKKVEYSKSASQIIAVTDGLLYLGKNCSYCREKIEDYKENLYSCEECGVLYHESCLNLLMNEGFCLYCNRTLLW